MLELHRFLLGPAVAMAGIVLAVPVAARCSVASDRFTGESATQPTQLAMTELKDQNATPRQELGQNTAGSGDSRPASAAFSDSPSHSSSVSSNETKDKKNGRKKDKNKAKPAPSDQEEQFNRALLGIYG